VDTYGVRTTDLHDVVRETYRLLKRWPVDQRDACMELLWENGGLEAGGVVCHVYRRFASEFGQREFRLFTGWVDRYARNWALTDGIAAWLLAVCIENEPELRLKLTPWTRSKNRWKRRASAVALLREAKYGRNTAFLLDTAARLLPDRDDMVEKGVGWLLKETYPARPRETVAFLLEQKQAASRLTLRYAAEKMSAADRQLVLG